MTDRPQSLAGLSLAEKRILLARMTEEANQSGRVFPLSHGQRGLWFLHQIDPGGAAYNLCYPIRIRSPLDLPAFRRALQAVVDRHGGLRTTFEARDGELVQRVRDTAPIDLEVVEAAAWTDDVLRDRLRDLAHRPFDLENGPLIHMRLFHLGPDDHLFLLTVHHLVADFQSLVTITEEMARLYPAERTGRRSPPAEAGPTYEDFVRAQAALLASAEGERLGAYWASVLAGAPRVLDLPTDRPRPPVLSSRGGGVPCRIGAGLTRRLEALAAAEGVTLYAVLLAAFQTLLGRTANQGRFLVGSPFAGRMRPEFARVVGCFINMLPLRADLSGDPPFRQFLRRTAGVVLEALEHQDYPFALIVERLRVERDPCRIPLVQVTFTLERAILSSGEGRRAVLNQAGARSGVGGIEWEYHPVELDGSQSDLELILEEGDGAIGGVLRFNGGLFDAPTARRMVGQFLTLLGSAADDPDCYLSELRWLTPDEERQVVRDWNRTRAAFPHDECLHRLFERQAARTPDAVAVSLGNKSLTFGKLDALATRLARRLRRRGVGRGTHVGLFLERSPEMVVAILAALKAGAAFVPLDPDGPVERLRLVLADIAAPVLLTHRSLMDRLRRADAGAECIAVEERWPDEAVDFEEVRGDDLAYIVYTSGSTGRPKGVMVEHRAICNTVLWEQRDLPIRADDRVLLTMPYYFDAALCVLFPTLSSGGRVVLAGPGAERDPFRLVEQIERDDVTVLTMTPNALSMLVEGASSASCRTVRRIHCGGEAMPPDLPARLFSLLDVELINRYGPTETAVDATWWRCPRGDHRPIVPIGRPIANVQTYVLDAHRAPLPPGVPGELYVGGAGLARGYLNDPAQTAERFVPDPFRHEPGARLYRTGDRCRWLAGGTLEFLGRLDHQVKLRGYRIELGEVEAALLSHPAVREAVVGLYGSSTDARLVAHLVAGEGPLVTDDLRKHLKERLPAYMVPANFLLMPALPLSPNGKVDRRALPAPPAERPATAREYVAPRTPLEEFLASLWREVLGLDRVGALDNFFDLGGHSIGAALLVHRLRERLDRPISTVAVFDSPTVAGLARHLAEVHPDLVATRFGASSATAEDARLPSPFLVPLQPEGSRPPLFMVHPPGGIVVCYQPLARHIGRDQPFFGIRSRGLDGGEDLPTRLEEMAAEYAAAIRQAQPRGPYRLGGWSAGGLVALEVAQQLLAQGEEVALLALLDTGLPHNPDESGQEYGLDRTLEELARLGPDELLPYLWNHAQKLGLVDTGTPVELVRQILDDLKRLFHLHLSLADAYALRPYAGKITLFRPAESPVAVSKSADRGWAGWAASVEVHTVPGQHHSMVKEPHARELAAKLSACCRAGTP
jgi:amino acid adenylation domain-containing protein